MTGLAREDHQVRADWRYWLALKLVPGVGNVTYRELIEGFSAPRAVFEASPASLTATGVHSQIARAIAGFDDWDCVERELARIERTDIRVVVLTDPEYPENLARVHDPPPFLYVRGTFTSRDQMAIAVVGSRTAGAYGLRVARDLARELAEEGITVVSGLARGIDAAAHQGALNGAGRTIAVLGSGPDVVYPPEHTRLADDIATKGVVVSEFALGSQPHAGHFPYRNRVISGLSLGVVVVEATEKSGSLITARSALDQNREVFAVPGPITASRSRGPHLLIKDGAKLVESVDDILCELGPGFVARRRMAPDRSPGCSLEEARMLELCRAESVHVDDLILGTGYEPGRVLELLLGLELRGLVSQRPGMYFIGLDAKYGERMRGM